ncbi:MAG: PKD domain-containing protein [Chitinophagaceae bacterium]
MRKLLVALCVCISAVVSQAQQIAKGLTASNGVFIGFYEYKPTNYSTNTKYPLIIFLHGIGERGNGTTDLPSVLNNGTPSNIKNGSTMTFTWNGKTETFLVLTPQLSNNYGSWPNFYVDEMLNYAKKNLSIDTNRVFLAGLSLGGGGVWSYAGSTLDNAKKFAALGISCGTEQYVNFCNIASANLPVWAFHATNDGTVSVNATYNNVNKLNACNPAVKPYMTIWPDGDHWIWGRVFDEGYTWNNPSIYEWFLSQNRTLPVNIRPTVDAGSDLRTTASDGTATLRATASDKDGKILRYVWRKIGGPGWGTMQNAVSTDGVATVSQMWTAGTYVYEVKAIDDRAEWALDTMSVVVTDGAAANQAPTANAGSNTTITLPTNSATLNGSASKDPDGSIASYAWSYVSGPTQYTIASPSAATTTVSNLAQGTYVFKLTVTDNAGATASATVNVVVNAAANQAPTANAGSNTTITLPTNSATLNGSASKDSDGSITSYAWSYVSGPTQYTIVSPAASTTTVSNLVQGTYVFKLIVTDNAGATASATVNIVVNAANQSPTANAGVNATITLPTNSISLNGTASKDPDGSIASYAWSWVSGPTQYTIATPSASTTTVSNLVQGTYVFNLVVTDNNGATASATVQITVNAASGDNANGGTGSPTIKIDAGPDIILTLPANSTTLNGSASDSRGPIQAYKWVKIAGPDQYTIASPTSAITAITNLVEGTYSFRFDVWDNAWYPRGDTVIVTVKAATTTSPVISVNAGADINITLPTNSTTLTGTASDSRGPIQAYKWVKIGGPDQYTLSNATSASTTLSNLVAGTYTFRFDIWDYAWYPRGDTVVVTVNPGATAPVIKVNAGPDITLTLPTNSTTLSGTASDSRGPIQAYKWVKIGGPDQYTLSSETSATTTLSNLVAGTYTFRFDIWDNAWYPRGDTMVVTVNPIANSAPVIKVNAGPDITLTLPTNSTTLSGTASDTRGPIQAYKWVKIGGPDQYTLSSETSATTTLSNLVAGTYTFRFDIWDNAWYPRGDTMVVTVNPAAASGPSIKVNAGPDLSITLPTNSVTLSGTASDSRGPIQAYKWVKIGGPDQYTIGSETSATTTLSNLVAGTYTFRFDIWDNAWYPRGDTMVITVNPPAANTTVISVYAGADVELTLPTNSVTLKGSAYDSRGPIQAYKWVKIGGPTQYTLSSETTAATTLSNLVAGTYTFRFDIWDNAWYPRGDTIVVTVKPATVITVNAGADINITLPTNSTTLKGTASDSRGPIQAYKWVKIGGPDQYTLSNPTAATTTLSNLTIGTYTFRFDIWDYAWYPRGDTVVVNVMGNVSASAVTRAAVDAQAQGDITEKLSLYPNPVIDEFNLQYTSASGGKGVINIFDVHGKLLRRVAVEKNSILLKQYINVSGFASGTYYVELIIDNKRTTAKFIKQ